MDIKMSDTNKKVIMLGNEAIARGAYEAGVKVSAANSQDTMVGTSSSSATLPKRKHYSKKSVRM